jgi:hypothetical protein
MLTAYHAKYFSHELTKRCPSDSVEKLPRARVDTQDEIDRRREQLIKEIEGKLQQRVSSEHVFTIRWTVK